MAPNPNPARTTAPMWRFIERVLALEPDDFVFAGAYVRKSGYHATVADNLASWPGTYSVRLAADLRGPRDKGRALDIKSRQAAAGKQPTIMARYGARMRAAAKARDPRVRKWREVLGQFDVDTPPEAIDFQTTVERVPDDTHEWHFHWSILTAFVDDPEAYDAMYSVLIGQSLADYLQNGADDMYTDEDRRRGYNVDETVWQGLVNGAPVAKGLNIPGQKPADRPIWLVAKLTEVAADARSGRVAVEALAAAIAAGGGSVETTAILARMDQLAAAEVARELELLGRIADLESELAAVRAAAEANLSPAERAAVAGS